MNRNAASEKHSRGRSLAVYAALALLALALDQWVKYWVETSLPFQEKIDILPFLALFRTFNTGIAFSMLSSFGDTGLIILSLVVSAFIVYMAIRSEPQQVFARLGFALILGGAMGNVIDRAFYGHVVDYILFHTPGWSFAVFNLADAFISVGAAMVVLEEFIIWRREVHSPKR